MKKKILLFLTLFILPFISVKALSSDYFSATTNVEPINHSVFIADNTINNEENVNGLAFLAGNNVNINGTYSYGMFAGNNVDIKGTINNDLFVAGNNVAIEQASMIERDLYAAGNTVSLSANLTGNAFMAGEEVTLNNITIDGDLNVSTSKLVITGNVIVNGTLSYSENTEIVNQDSLKAANVVISKATEKEVTNKVSSITMNLAMLLVLGLVMTLVFPKLFKKINDENDPKDIFITTLKGIAYLICVPIIFIILLCTVMGLELGFVLISIYVITLLLSIVATSAILGNYLLKKLFKMDNLYLAVTLGIIIFTLINLIPYIGPIVYFIAFAYGIGILWNIFKKIRN
jgi:cytoskeletal protein CcmA (bactofilin family)